MIAIFVRRGVREAGSVKSTTFPLRRRRFARGALRGSRTPDRIVFRDELPTTPTGKVLRREIIADLLDSPVTHR